jgi:hypothetical protein
VVTMITLRSTSREEDAALDALADLARAVADWDACRVVGGHMVAIHVTRAGANVQHRPTADADLAAPVAVLADPEFARRLNDLGYDMVDGSRLRRHTAHGEAFIDLIAPAPASRALHNQSAGRFRVDRFPGVQYVLNEPPVMVEINAVPLEGSPSPSFRVAVPTITAAIVVKALAARNRRKDKEDLHRLLITADRTDTALRAPPYDNLDIGRAAEYLHGPFLTGASQHVRALVDKTVPRPPERPTFTNL